jgi:drug/metabolite transporter (DMT)-like permease
MTSSSSPGPFRPALASGLSAVVMWGLAPVATRAAVLHLGPLPLLVLRALLAGLIVLPWTGPALRRQRRANPAQPGRAGSAQPGFARLAAAGLLGMVGYFLPVAVGIQWLPASTAALILATEPIWIMCLGRLCCGERVTRGAWLGSAVALGGVAALAGPRVLAAGAGGRVLAGLGLVMLGTMLFAAYTVVLRPVTEAYGARAATAASTAVGAVPYLALLPFALASHQLAHCPPSAWMDLVFLAVGSTVAGMLLWNIAVLRLGSSQAGLLLFLEPCVGVTGGVFLLGEHLSAAAAGGGALVMAGLVLAWRAAHVSLRNEAASPEVPLTDPSSQDPDAKDPAKDPAVGDASVPRPTPAVTHDRPLLPDRTTDETDVGWGDRPDPDDRDRLLQDRPPHWDDY